MRPERAARLRMEQARLIQIRLMDQVSREILEAHAQSQSLRGQIAVAESGIRVAGESYRRNLQRIRGGQGLPLEMLQLIQPLDQSRREYLQQSATTTSGNSGSIAPWAALFRRTQILRDAKELEAGSGSFSSNF